MELPKMKASCPNKLIPPRSTIGGASRSSISQSSKLFIKNAKMPISISLTQLRGKIRSALIPQEELPKIIQT